jgi:hypothetical protein
VLLYGPAEAAHHESVLSLCSSVFAILAPTEAADHRFDHRFFEAARGLRIGDNLRRVFRQIASGGVQPLKPV